MKITSTLLLIVCCGLIACSKGPAQADVDRLAVADEMIDALEHNGVGADVRSFRKRRGSAQCDD